VANPQKENGYTAIANEIIERLYSVTLSGSEYRILLCILRKTYGWHKKIDEIYLSQLVTETKLSRKQVCEVINKLVTKRLLVKHKKSTNEYGLNKNYDDWLVTERLLGSYRKVNQVVTKRLPKLVTEMEHTKERKETITKERNHHEKTLLICKELGIKPTDKLNEYVVRYADKPLKPIVDNLIQWCLENKKEVTGLRFMNWLRREFN